MPSPGVSFTQFAYKIVHERAVPELIAGYSDLINQLQANNELAALIKAKGIDNVLTSDNPAIVALTKGNKEFVTSAEKKAERLMSEAVLTAFPDHSIVGEEYGYQPGRQQIRWVFDPVDGTSAMVRTAMSVAFGQPLPDPKPAFGITVGVVDSDEAVAGVVVELLAEGRELRVGRTWVGGKGEPTTCDGQPIFTGTDTASLLEIRLASTVPPIMFKENKQWSGYQALQEATGKPTIIDQNCIGFMGLLDATNPIGVVYEADLAYHDVAALVPILTGAGIKATDASGNTLLFNENLIKQEFTIVATSPPLHDAAIGHIARGVEQARSSFQRSGTVVSGYATKFSPPQNSANQTPRNPT